MPLPPGTSLDAAARERVAALAALFQAAEAELAGIEAQLRSGSFQKRYIRERLKEARDVIDRLVLLERGRASGAVVQWARENFPETYRMGAGMAVRDLQSQSVRVVAGSQRIHARAVEALLSRYMGDATELIVQLNASLIRTSRVVLAQAGFGEQIAAGIVGGLPRRETSRMLERTLRRAVMEELDGVTEADLTHVEIGGRSYQISTWAEMHARTETARASTAGTRTMSAINGVEHVQITSHAHAPCICTPFEGRIYALRQDDPRFPWIGIVPNGGAPMHPNCVHREAPAVVEFMEGRGELEGRTRIPSDFVGQNDAELARLVRENRDQLDRYSRDRNGMLPENFKIRRARIAA